MRCGSRRRRAPSCCRRRGKRSGGSFSCGIEGERLKRIFGRFVQGSRSTEAGQGAVGSAPDGTGLGLALVRRLVELMHGQVSVESRVGHGTTFSFTLPLGATRLS